MEVRVVDHRLSADIAVKVLVQFVGDVHVVREDSAL
jgi:hypothetical protein